MATTLPTEVIALPGVDGARIEAKLADVGSGRPILFLHGLVGLNDHWEEVVRRVQPRARCVLLEIPLLDLRGENCSISGVTEITGRFLEEYFGGGRAKPKPIIVGNSFGGHVALRLAIDHPRLIGGLVLAGSSGMIERSMVSNVQLRPSREWLSRKIGELFYDPCFMRDADLDRAHRELSDRGGARAMVKLSRSARRNFLGDAIREITAPTLLIWGRNDVVTPPEAAAQFLERIGNSRIVWFDRCGHAPMIERPAEFAQALMEFADELDGCA